MLLDVVLGTLLMREALGAKPDEATVDGLVELVLAGRAAPRTPLDGLGDPQGTDGHGTDGQGVDVQGVNVQGVNGHAADGPDLDGHRIPAPRPSVAGWAADQPGGA